MAEDTRDLWTPVGRTFYFDGKSTEKKGKDKEGNATTYNEWNGLLIIDRARFSDIDKALYASLCERVDEIARVSFGKPWKDLPPAIRRGIRNGEERPDNPIYAGDTRFLNAKSYYLPTLIGPSKQVLKLDTPEFAQYVYPGAYARYKVRPKDYKFTDEKGMTSKGINFTLLGIQFFAGGEHVELGQVHDDAPEDDTWLAASAATDDLGF